MLFQDARLLPASKLALCVLWIRKELREHYTLSDQLVLFLSYSLREWAKNKTREQFTIRRAFKDNNHKALWLMLKAKLQKELTDALRAGDQLKRLVLGLLMTAIKNKELAKRGQIGKTTNDPRELEQKSQLTNEEVMEVVAGEVKKRRDSIEQFSAGGRKDLADKEKIEMEILLAYLPEQLSEEKIKNAVREAIEEWGALGPKEMGKLIGAVMTKLKGRADGGLVSKIVKELLNK